MEIHRVSWLYCSFYTTIRRLSPKGLLRKRSIYDSELKVFNGPCWRAAYLELHFCLHCVIEFISQIRLSSVTSARSRYIKRDFAISRYRASMIIHDKKEIIVPFFSYCFSLGFSLDFCNRLCLEMRAWIPGQLRNVSKRFHKSSYIVWHT